MVVTQLLFCASPDLGNGKQTVCLNEQGLLYAWHIVYSYLTLDNRQALFKPDGACFWNTLPTALSHQGNLNADSLRSNPYAVSKRAALLLIVRL